MGRKKSARDTVVPGDESPFKATVVSSADGANIINNLEKRIEKSKNLSQRGKKSFLADIAIDLKAKKDGSDSDYATFLTLNNKTVTVRLANHNASTSNFDYRSEKEGISIVISRNQTKALQTMVMLTLLSFSIQTKNCLSD